MVELRGVEIDPRDRHVVRAALPTTLIQRWLRKYETMPEDIRSKKTERMLDFMRAYEESPTGAFYRHPIFSSQAIIFMGRMTLPIETRPWRQGGITSLDVEKAIKDIGKQASKRIDIIGGIDEKDILTRRTKTWADFGMAKLLFPSALILSDYLFDTINPTIVNAFCSITRLMPDWLDKPAVTAWIMINLIVYIDTVCLAINFARDYTHKIKHPEA